MRNRVVGVNCQWCSAVNCANSRGKRPDLGFFRFPRDPERSRRWVINCRRADLDGKTAEALFQGNVLCEEHFEASYISVKNPKFKRLMKGAVPTIFKFPDLPIKKVPSSPSQEKHSSTHEDSQHSDQEGGRNYSMCSDTDWVCPDWHSHSAGCVSNVSCDSFTNPGVDICKCEPPVENTESEDTYERNSPRIPRSRKTRKRLRTLKDPEQTPNLFLGYTKKFKEAIQKAEAGTFNTEPTAYCSAKYCSSNCRSLDPRTGVCVVMHPFPDPQKDKERCLKWITNLENDSLNLSNLTSKRVCALHFEECAYNIPFILGNGTLLPDAVPVFVTSANTTHSSLIGHLNRTIEDLQTSLEEERMKIRILEAELKSQNEIKRKELEESYENFRRVCFLASLDS